MKYNIFAAIEMRSIGIWDDIKGENIPVDFKTSVELAKDELFMWGYEYPGDAILEMITKRNKKERVTKEVWKRVNHIYREHYYSIMKSEELYNQYKLN